jgi:hypothetical protein
MNNVSLLMTQFANTKLAVHRCIGKAVINGVFSRRGLSFGRKANWVEPVQCGGFIGYTAIPVSGVLKRMSTGLSRCRYADWGEPVR